MKARALLALLFSFCLAFSSSAQKRSHLLFGEFSSRILSAEVKNEGRIRHDANTVTHLVGELTSQEFVIGDELFTSSKKISFSAGIGYRRADCTLRRSFQLLGNDFYYFLFRQSGTTTEYLKFLEIHQITDELTLPIEVKFIPWGIRRFTVYFVAGGRVNTALNVKHNIVFFDSSMETFESELASSFDEPSAVTALLDIGAGVRYSGKRGEGPVVGLELAAPSVSIGGSSQFVTPSAGVGFAIHFGFPLNSLSNESE